MFAGTAFRYLSALTITASEMFFFYNRNMHILRNRNVVILLHTFLLYR